MLALPIIGPLLTWLAGPFLSLAKGIGTQLGQIVSAALKNPYVLGALVAGAFFLLWQHEEGDKAAIRAQDAKTIASYQADLNTVLVANKTLLTSLNWQTGQVRALAAAEQKKTLAAIAAQAAAQRGVEAAQAVARHVEAYTPPAGSSDASAALDILKGKAD